MARHSPLVCYNYTQKKVMNRRLNDQTVLPFPKPIWIIFLEGNIIVVRDGCHLCCGHRSLHALSGSLTYTSAHTQTETHKHTHANMRGGIHTHTHTHTHTNTGDFLGAEYVFCKHEHFEEHNGPSTNALAVMVRPWFSHSPACYPDLP